MNIRITIQYHTHFGESLVLRIGKKRYPMDPAYANIWQKELTGRNLRDGDAYTFEVERDGKTVRREWRAHRYEAPAGGASLVIRERWNDRPANSTFYAAAFSDVIFRRPDGVSFRNPRPTAPWKGNVAFRVAAEMGDRYLDALDEFEDVISDNVATNIFDRHLKPIFL